jgi:hypothetical protein
MSTRYCYICGRATARRRIAEPLLVPVCLERECDRQARQLPARHCSARLPDGHLCCAPAAAQLGVQGERLCVQHLQAQLERSPSA